MRIIPTIMLALLATRLAGCISYSRHDLEERIVEHRSGSYHDERSHSYGGYYGNRHDDHHHHRGRGHDDRHHPRGR